MADSDNSMSLSFVTRRRLLAGTAIAILARSLPDKMWAWISRDDGKATDPAISLWHDWKKALGRAEELCRSQQHLETRLIRSVGFPHVKILLPGEELPVSAFTLEEIADIFGSDPGLTDRRQMAEAEFIAFQALWDAADQQIGYSEIRREERDAAAHKQEFVDRVPVIPASSLAGIAGKLDIILREGEPCEGSMDFPWPHIRSTLADLRLLGMEREPNHI